MAHDFGVPGQRCSRRQVVEFADQFRDADQARLARHVGGLVRLPGHVAIHEAQDLPPLLVAAEEPGRSVPAGPLEEVQKPVHEPGAGGGAAPHRVADPDHGADRTAQQRNLRH